ncbi:hypothetical protein JHK84_055718 [Glycine max]|nr:hypothetical protein JHK84_055718 [Glycine max]
MQFLFVKTSMVLYTDADDAAMVRLFSSVSCLSKGVSEPHSETLKLGLHSLVISLSMRLHT